VTWLTGLFSLLPRRPRHDMPQRAAAHERVAREQQVLRARIARLEAEVSLLARRPVVPLDEMDVGGDGERG
jgi:hypothetical protein